MAIVYLETNFLIGLTLGQEAEGEALLREAERTKGLQLAIPTVCFMEAVATIRRRIKEWEALRERLKVEMTQLERSPTFEVSRQLLERFAEARLASGEYVGAIMSNFRRTARRVGSVSRLIPAAKSTLEDGFSSILILESRQPDLILPDNLILHCILRHAKSRPAISKALLSGNSAEFSRPEVQTAFKSAGIDKYFTEAKNALGWYRSRLAP